jgi:DNA polymerase III delta prime subunit
MLFDEPIKEESKKIEIKEVKAPQEVAFSSNDGEFISFHEKLKNQNLHHAILLPEFYAIFPDLLQDVINKISSHSFERFDVKPNENGNILMESIEEALRFIQKTSFSMAKIIVIYGVCKMSSSVANAILKSLEEPPKDTFFILLYKTPEKILKTIKSRAIIKEFASCEKNFNFLFENFIPKEITKQEITDLIGFRLNLIHIFKNAEMIVLISNFDKLLENFSYINFKKFFKENEHKEHFKDVMFLLIEGKIAKLKEKNYNLYFHFILQKKYAIIYNTNLEVFLYYTIYKLCYTYL